MGMDAPDPRAGRPRRAAGQPRGARGSVGHAYSALNLRLALAIFGLVVSVLGAGLAFLLDRPGFGVLLIVLALAAIADIVVVQRRRAQRRRGDPTRHDSLFE